MNQKRLFTVLGILCASVANLSANNTVPWIPSHDYIPPSARPFDPVALTQNHKSFQSDGVKNTRNFNQNETTATLEWIADASGAPNGSGFASLNFYDIPADVLGKFIGIQVTLDASAPARLVGEFYHLKKNFLDADKLVSTQPVDAIAGSNTLVFRFNDKLPPKQHAAINGFAIRAPLKDGQSLTFRVTKIEFLFPSRQAAAALREVRQNTLLENLAITATWIKDRGIDPGFPEKQSARLAPETEQKLWTAVQLLALREQITHWTKITAAPELTSQRATLATLISTFPKLSPSDARRQTAALQSTFDATLDKLLAEIPFEVRRWKSAPGDAYFRTSDGERFRMFAPHFFRSLYPPWRPGASWRPADLRYLSALGFNGIRLKVQWNHLEPEQGKFNQEYVNMLRDIMREAERYGFGVSIDHHWPYPEWFMKGAPGYEAKKEDRHRHASFHWPDALVDTWARIGETFKDIPNIVAFELISNETHLANGKRGLKAYPYAVKMWNDWLRLQYNNNREALADAWNVEQIPNATHALQPHENWDNLTIEPLGYQNDVSPAAAYENNPRLYDTVRFIAWIQTDLTSRIMTALRKNIPDAEGMFQYTMGDVWDKSPVPVDYHSISTLADPRTHIGTHYGMGNKPARKARSISAYKSYDTEQQMENRWEQVRRHVRLGLGFCPFSAHARGGGGMFFSGDDWYLKREVAYLPKQADWIRTYWPEPDNKTTTGEGIPGSAGVLTADNAKAAPNPKTAVAIIENTRRAAAMQSTVGDLLPLLESRQVAVNIFESLRIIRDPSLLDNHDAVIVESTQLDTALLEILRKNYKGLILLHGRLDQDAFARTGKHSVLSNLAATGILFAGKGAAQAPDESAEIPARLDISGSWDWAPVGLGGAKTVASMPAPRKLPGTLDWQPLNVPGPWPEIGLLGSSKFHTGDAWYRKTVKIPAAWKGRSLRIKIGAIDDFDWVFLNGRIIGKTGSERSNWWTAPREYTLPPNLVRFGDDNELHICVRNDSGNGGIIKGPVAIVSETTPALHWSDGQTGIPRIGAKATILAADRVHPEAVVLARTGTGAPALIRHNNWFWWIGNTAWQTADPVDQKILRQLLRK